MPVFRDDNCDYIGISFTENSKIIVCKHTPGIFPKSIYSLAHLILLFYSVAPKYSLINSIAKWLIFLMGISLIRRSEGFFADFINSNIKNYLEHITWVYSEFTQKVYQHNSYSSISLNNH